MEEIEKRLLHSFVERRSINPFHPHCGPFNTISDEPSSDPIDEACRQHDIAYGELQAQGINPYITNSDADDIFIKRMDELNPLGLNPFANFYGKVFKLKRAGINWYDDFKEIPEVPVKRQRIDDIKPLPLPPLAKPEVVSFGKMPRSRRISRKRSRRGRKRMRRRKAVRISKGALLKALGSKFTDRTAWLAIMNGKQSATQSNRMYLFHAITFNDFNHYNALVQTYGPTIVARQPDQNANQTNQQGYYVSYTKADMNMTNVSNFSVVVKPIKFVLRHDLVTEASASSQPHETTAYNLFRQLVQLDVANEGDATDSALVVRADTTPGTATFTNSNISIPNGYPIPWSSFRKYCDIKFGPAFKLGPGECRKMKVYGRKGYEPKRMIWDTPSSGLASSSVPRAPCGYAKKTVLYCFLVQTDGHVGSVAETTEYYQGGPFKLAVDINRMTVCHNYTSQAASVSAWNDERPNCAANDYQAMEDSSYAETVYRE